MEETIIINKKSKVITDLEKENERLKTQIEALNFNQEFLEDCLIEIAQVVYE